MYTPFKIFIPIWKAKQTQGGPLEKYKGGGPVLEIAILGVTHIYYYMQGVSECESVRMSLCVLNVFSSNGGLLEEGWGP